MNIEQLISSNTGGVYQFATASAAAHPPRFPEATNYLTVDTVIVSDKASFLDATSTALGFPDYFGGNWDAFYDCLTDQAEQVEQSLVVVYADLSTFAQRQPDAFWTAIDIMKDAVAFWVRGAKRLTILVGLNDPKLAPGVPAISFV